ncbi:integral membrane protein [Shewanella sairae]|uniref:Integral membrane protein n=1 Tax=Shewanella sairae TaxID=190310 RepID=A0ABQ4PR27_9GAMM|nr:metal-dependent hydrolase [Shewanella sairae]MCL1129634.1 metal-dependent hydrolase [Shewanella sairae]GIU51616.1 integral membrane protein [Shewanella sairae]
MDSITQAALGATVAGAIAGKRCNGKVLLAGALLGTLPDLDVFIDYGDDISNTVKHRGFSHSLLILLPFSLLLTAIIERIKPLEDWSFSRLWLLIAACLITHPLLDNFTSYGTQLLWPIPGYFSLSSVFIIDPLYTLPLLISLAVGMARKASLSRYCAIALCVSSLYLAWSLAAKLYVEQRTIASLDTLGIKAESVFITPTPFNTLLWRIVVLDGDEYWEGLASVLDTNQQVEFIAQKRGNWPLSVEPEQLQALKTFTDGFVRFDQQDKQLVVSDLRLGMFGNLAFKFVFAEQDRAGQWQAILPTRLAQGELRGDMSKLKDRALGDQQINASLDLCPSPCGLNTAH